MEFTLCGMLTILIVGCRDKNFNVLASTSDALGGNSSSLNIGFMLIIYKTIYYTQICIWPAYDE